MIDRSYGKFVPICDGCGAELDAEDTFEDAKKAIEENGWQTKKYGSDYVNYCDDCEV